MSTVEDLRLFMSRDVNHLLNAYSNLKKSTFLSGISLVEIWIVCLCLHNISSCKIQIRSFVLDSILFGYIVPINLEGNNNKSCIKVVLTAQISRLQMLEPKLSIFFSLIRLHRWCLLSFSKFVFRTMFYG